MAKTLLELAEASSRKMIEEAYGKTDDAKVFEKQTAQFSQTEKLLYELLRPTDNRPKNLPKIEMKEAVHTADFRVLLPRVIQGLLQQPVEPNYIGQSLLARTIQVEGHRIMEFPTLGAIRAYELGDTEEPPEQDPSVKKNITEIRVRRFGLKLELSQDIVDESQWDLVGLYTNAAGSAMRRKKEELIFTEYGKRAIVVFDNSLAQSAGKWTTGVGSDGVSPNGTFDHLDLLDMMAALGANGYNPSDVILHPLAWAVWAKDPYLHFQLLFKGGVGQSFGQFQGTGVDMNANQYVPFGLNVVVSPFQDVSYRTNLSNPGVTGGVAANYTTITVVDRNSSILVMEKTPMSVAQWENPLRDIQNMMFHEKYGLALLNGGRSAVQAKNIRIDQNFQPVYTVRNVTLS
jgi:hypothetical protein